MVTGRAAFCIVSTRYDGNESSVSIFCSFGSHRPIAVIVAGKQRSPAFLQQRLTWTLTVLCYHEDCRVYTRYQVRGPRSI